MCCSCNGQCNHTGNHTFCAQHGGQYGLANPYQYNNNYSGIGGLSQLPKGWECPKCTAVMAPFIPSCINCKGNK